MKGFPRMAAVSTHEGNPLDLSKDNPTEDLNTKFLAHLRAGHPGESGLDSVPYLVCLDNMLRSLALCSMPCS